MKTLIIIIALATAGCAQPAANKPDARKTQIKTQTCKYICPMDKDVCADKPGICPKCGMKLLKKKVN